MFKNLLINNQKNVEQINYKLNSYKIYKFYDKFFIIKVSLHINKVFKVMDTTNISKTEKKTC